MTYRQWRLLVGDKEEREWSGREYLFRIGSNQRDADPILRELQSNTPLRNIIDTSIDDKITRVICYLSYYLVNPTFRAGDTSQVGTDFFWFPLDRLTQARYDEMFGHLDDDEEEPDEDEDDDEADDAALPDFPLMSTIGKPIIEAATSEDYISQIGRVSIDERQSILQDEIKRRQEERVEEIEQWLEEGFEESGFKENFSAWADRMGRFPAQFLLAGVYNERSRIEEIHDIFSSMDPVDDPSKLNPQFLLRRLTRLTEKHPALVNPAIEGFCLDQHDRDCDFHITKHRGYELEGSLEQCEHCGSDLFRVFRSGIDETVRDAWMMGLLPEFVTARIFETCDWVEEVIPHRMVQMKTNTGLTSSVEVDVMVHTGDDKTLFFEVTSQREALDRVVKKKRKFQENGIEYDGLIQLSLTDNDSFIDFGDSTIAGGAWMITGLETEEFYEDMIDHLGLA